MRHHWTSGSRQAVAPKQCAQMQEACLAGDFAAALKLQDRLTPLQARDGKGARLESRKRAAFAGEGVALMGCGLRLVANPARMVRYDHH
jgi:dihydrodipicolinate synthase/N-acetylneuraminate lyase